MYVFKRVKDLQNYLSSERVNKRTLGFVPTMGALHQGHLSLIQQSLDENQITVCSIFVNPTQFNEASDLEKYPRTPDKDIQKLASVGCQVVFLPPVQEVYPNGTLEQVDFDFAGLDTMMEGAKRPGHFAGMAQVVKRLLDIVTPNFLYMGQKDYQQQLIVRQMIKELQINTKLVMVATEREADGLAMSSRNVLLTPQNRAHAPILFQTLEEAKKQLAAGTASTQIEAWAMESLGSNGFKPEYFSIVNGHNLQTIQTATDSDLIVACTAVWAGKVRLIDNMVLKGKV